MRNRDLKRGGAQGVWLRTLRSQNGLHQADLAEKLGISRSQLAFYEAGGDLPMGLRDQITKLYPDDPYPVAGGNPESSLAVVKHFRSSIEFDDPPEMIDKGLLWIGSLPRRERFGRVIDQAVDSLNTVFTTPQLSAVAEFASEVSRPVFGLRTHDYACWTRKGAPSANQICLVQDMDEGGRLDLAVVTFSEVAEWEFTPPTIGVAEWNEPAIMARLAGVFRRTNIGGRFWYSPRGLTAADLDT